MREISKLSLITIIALSSFSYTNAKPLEEAIKNVEVSGSVVYRYENMNDEYHSKRSEETNKYKIALGISSKINDDVQFNSRFIVGNKIDNDFITLEAHHGSDANAELFLTNANFSYTGIKNTTIIAGKQGINTPWTMAVDSDSMEHTGTGVLALTNWKMLTVGVGYFNQTNLNQSTDMTGSSLFGTQGFRKSLLDIINDSANGDNLGSRDMYIGTLLVDLSPVKLEAWYMNVTDTLDSFTLVANTSFKPSPDSQLGFEARYVNLHLENPDVILESSNNAMWKFSASGSIGIVNANIDYSQTDKDGGLTSFDVDSPNNTSGWNSTSNGIPDAKHYAIRVGVNLIDNLELAGYYGKIKSDGGNYNILENYEGEEYFAQLTYIMSKNFTGYLRCGNYNEKLDDEIKDQDMTRLQIEYTF